MTGPDPVLAEPGRLTLACADLDARPLFWTDPDGTRHGVEAEIAEAVGERIGLPVRWRFLIWSEFRPALERGEVDAIWCGSAITPERRTVFDYSRPYANIDESVLVLADSPVSRPEDLAGMRVGAIAESTNMALAETFPDVTRVPFDGTSDDIFAEMVDALRDGTIDALVDDEPAFLGLVEGDAPAFRIAFTVPTGQKWGAALRPGSDALRTRIDEGLEGLLADGTLRAIWQRHVPTLRFGL